LRVNTICSTCLNYGVSHLAVGAIISIYRKTHNLNISLGIFFNHESEFRGLQFVTRKISSGIAEIKSGRKDPIRLGNFSASRDWSCAYEFIFGVTLLMNKSNFDDYVFASGKSTSVRDLLTVSASIAGFDPKFEGSGLNEVCFDFKFGAKLALSDQKFHRSIDLYMYVGDTTKLSTETGWKPTRKFTEVIEQMTKVDIFRVSK